MNLKKYLFYFRKKKTRCLLNYEKHKNLIENELEGQSILGIDTEFDWRNTYFPKLSLIQISTKKRVLLIDCLNLEECSSLKNIFSKCELLIFHSVRSDTTVLSSALNIKVENVFDIQIAEKVLTDNSNKSYGSIVQRYFPINLKKSETNSNWLKRPLSNLQIDYAADDVEYLIEIYELQKKLLRNKFFHVLSESKKEAILGNQKFYISRIAKLKSASSLEKKLYMWRENLAIKKNVPSSYVLKDKKMKMIFNILKKDKNSKKITEILGSSDLVENLLESVKK